MKRHELFKFMATIHPEFRSVLEEWGREMGQSPKHFMEYLQDQVQKRYEQAKRLPHEKGTEADLYILTARDIAIIFTVDEWWLVIRGIGNADGPHMVIAPPGPPKESVH
jgi:hypothetical protein